MKVAVALVLAILSALLLGAHFLRDGSYAGVAVSLVTPAVLLARRAWAVRVVQAFLVVAAGIWTHAAIGMVQQRMLAGQPWIRLAVILGSVALVAVAGALTLQAGSVRQRLARPRGMPPS